MTISKNDSSKNNYENYIILLMGIAGTGKRTIGEALAKKTNFRFVPHHSWIDPILNLLGDNRSIMWELNEQGWNKLNDARDVIFSTIADVCPAISNFIITFEMLDKNPYHQAFYDKVLEVVAKRKAHFLPVRLLCDQAELVIRVQSEDRKKYFKTLDADLIRDRVKNNEVFYSGHENEITINNTDKSPEQVADIIIERLNKIKAEN